MRVVEPSLLRAMMVSIAALQQILYRGQKAFWKLLRPRTRGVKVMIFNDRGEILLVRNSYGATQLFVLPGGGVRPRERPSAAAHREIREELSCGLSMLKPLSTHLNRGEGKRDTVHVFEAFCAETPHADAAEILEARYFALDALPPTTSPATARRLAERNGEVPVATFW